jgi:hypothetical protein
MIAHYKIQVTVQDIVRCATDPQLVINHRGRDLPGNVGSLNRCSRARAESANFENEASEAIQSLRGLLVS